MQRIIKHSKVSVLGGGKRLAVANIILMNSVALCLNAKTETAASASGEKTFAAKVPASLLQMGAASHYYSPYAFVVDKKARTLTVWTQELNGYRSVAQFPTDVGRTDGDKRTSGDHRTPEGFYFLVDRREGPGLDFSQYGQRAFMTDYPNFFDRREGKTGNGIWLHAVPDHVPLTRGSRGCVVVRNNAIMDLTQYVSLKKTPILIEKEVEYIAADDLRNQAQHLTQMLESWRAAWERKDIERYIAFYGDEFKAMNMGREQWRVFKQDLNKRYDQLGIKLSRPVILRYKDLVVARFLQAYTSDQHADFGEKTLYLKKTSAAYQIVGEEWQADASNVAREELEAGPLAIKVCSPGIDKDCAASAKADTN